MGATFLLFLSFYGIIIDATVNCTNIQEVHKMRIYVQDIAVENEKRKKYGKKPATMILSEPPYVVIAAREYTEFLKKRKAQLAITE